MSIRPLIALAVLALAGCASMPERLEMLEQARTAVANVNRDPMVGQAAPEQLRKAEARLSAAEQAYADRDAALAEHEAYLALRHAQIAQEQIAEARMRDEIRQSEVARTATQLRARELEVEQARAAASAAGEQVLQARSEAQAAREEAARLEQELHAQQTERGLVLTLGDVLFDTARATLKPGAGETLNRLAAFMRDAPDRRVLVEGHTDSRGTAEYNAELSERRAAAVRDALVQRGIEPARVAAVGAGENYPVASNDTTAGMQLNRRVEIVISDEQGNFPSAATRAGMSPAFPGRSACVQAGNC